MTRLELSTICCFYHVAQLKRRRPLAARSRTFDPPTIDILTPGGVVADALDIESTIHLFPVIFPIWVGTFLLMKMAGIR